MITGYNNGHMPTLWFRYPKLEQA